MKTLTVKCKPWTEIVFKDINDHCRQLHNDLEYWLRDQPSDYNCFHNTEHLTARVPVEFADETIQFVLRWLVVHGEEDIALAVHKTEVTTCIARKEEP